VDSSVLSLPVTDRSTVASSARAHALPWHLAAVVFAATSVIVGLIWDISWHMTIGRDTFWTPAHLAIYTGGAVAGLSCGFEVLRRSFVVSPTPSDGVTVWRYFNGPLGGWLAIWGAVAMLTSAPFDDWWHDAYGLDVKIISPPHSLLALGFLTILAGALVMAQAEQTRDVERAEATGMSPWIVAYTSGLLLTMLSIFTTEFHEKIRMHSGIFYIVSALVFPFVLVAAARATRLRFPATATAAVYSAVMCVQLWVLPLFAASPKLGPIRTMVTHMVPLDFPLLLIAPAFVIDLLMRATASRGAWTRALVLGVAFLVALVAVQWPFADFLVSPASKNALFHSDNFPYMMPQDSWVVLGRFVREPMDELLRGFAIATVLAVLSARVGLGWGNWLKSVKR
jgi:hypothetical protein